MAVLFGTCVPDVAYKALHDVLQVPRDFAEATSTPAGVIVICYVLSFLFLEKERPGVFIGLVFGSLLHLLLDSLKAHLGTGASLAFFPVSFRSYGFEAYLPENSAYATVPAVAVALLAEWIFRRGGGSRGALPKARVIPGGGGPALPRAGGSTTSGDSP